MNPTCPTCEVVFEREPGYFSGAMYISYAMAVPIVAVVSLLISQVFPAWSYERVVAIAFFALLPLTPVLFRYSRILWIHFDRAIG